MKKALNDRGMNRTVDFGTALLNRPLLEAGPKLHKCEGSCQLHLQVFGTLEDHLVNVRIVYEKATVLGVEFQEHHDHVGEGVGSRLLDPHGRIIIAKADRKQWLKAGLP